MWLGIVNLSPGASHDARVSRPLAVLLASPGRWSCRSRLRAAGYAARVFSSLAASFASPCRRPLCPAAGHAAWASPPPAVPLASVYSISLAVSLAPNRCWLRCSHEIPMEHAAENDSGESNQQWLSISATFGQMASTIFFRNIP
jgi:hypothetical protein